MASSHRHDTAGIQCAAVRIRVRGDPAAPAAAPRDEGSLQSREARQHRTAARLQPQGWSRSPPCWGYQQGAAHGTWSAAGACAAREARCGAA